MSCDVYACTERYVDIHMNALLINTLSLFGCVQQLEADLALHGNQVKVLEDQANRLVLAKHFDSETIKAKAAELTKRSGH